MLVVWHSRRDWIFRLEGSSLRPCPLSFVNCRQPQFRFVHLWRRTKTALRMLRVPKQVWTYTWSLYYAAAPRRATPVRPNSYHWYNTRSNDNECEREALARHYGYYSILGVCYFTRTHTSPWLLLRITLTQNVTKYMDIYSSYSIICIIS